MQKNKTFNEERTNQLKSDTIYTDIRNQNFKTIVIGLYMLKTLRPGKQFFKNSNQISKNTNYDVYDEKYTTLA